jgi:hypothetical protein
MDSSSSDDETGFVVLGDESEEDKEEVKLDIEPSDSSDSEKETVEQDIMPSDSDSDSDQASIPHSIRIDIIGPESDGDSDDEKYARSYSTRRTKTRPQGRRGMVVVCFLLLALAGVMIVLDPHNTTTVAGWSATIAILLGSLYFAFRR